MRAGTSASWQRMQFNQKRQLRPLAQICPFITCKNHLRKQCVSVCQSVCIIGLDLAVRGEEGEDCLIAPLGWTH